MKFGIYFYLKCPLGALIENNGIEIVHEILLELLLVEMISTCCHDKGKIFHYSNHSFGWYIDRSNNQCHPNNNIKKNKDANWQSSGLKLNVLSSLDV